MGVIRAFINICVTDRILIAATIYYANPSALYIAEVEPVIYVRLKGTSFSLSGILKRVFTWPGVA